jgi:trimeric autotransporter adhesin
MKLSPLILLYIPISFAWTIPARAAAVPSPAYRIETVAGSGVIGDGGLATEAQITNIQGVAVDSGGNLYLSDTANHRVRKVSPAGVISTIAGTGSAGFSGDNGPAKDAQINLPYGLAVDPAGSVYVADLGNNRVRRIAPDGTITTVAGTGHDGPPGDGGGATDAVLLTPRNVALDAAGNLYIAEFFGHRVRKVSPDGKIVTVAGIGVAGFSGDYGAATSAQLGFPAGLAVDRNGIMYIADSQNKRVRQVSPSGVISTALNGNDPNNTTIAFSGVIGLALDVVGTLLYVTDGSAVLHSFNTATKKWTTVAGTGGANFFGDGGPAVSARLTFPQDLAVDLTGNLLIADGVRVRKIDSRGLIQTLAGDGYLHALGDGGQAGVALLSMPSAVALDSTGTLYVADTGTQRVRQVLPSGMIRTLAGTGVVGDETDQTPVALAAATPLHSPMGVAVDPSGNVIIADTNHHRIRQVGADGRIRILVGTGTPGTGAEGLPPAQMPLKAPQGVCIDHTGTTFIVDTSNNRVLRAAPAAPVVTAAGNGAPGDAGDGGAARWAQLKLPSACALNSAGDLFIADTGSIDPGLGGSRIRKVTAAGIISTVAGTGTPGFSGDEGLAIAANLHAPRGVAVDDAGNIFIADTGNNRIRQVTPDGIIHTIAGQDSNGFVGDGGSAQAAQLDAPGGLFLDGSGALYVADTNNNRIRRLVPDLTLPPPALAATLTAVSAASQRQSPAAPGEIVTIFGAGIGPVTGISGTFDSTGLLPNLLGGSEVRFDGVPAPLFYAQSGQINVQVPYTVKGNSLTHVEVFYQGHSYGTLDLPVAAATPALFAIAINQDGSINSETLPAPRGTILTFFATGEGLTDGPNIAGQAAGAPYPHPLLTVTLAIAGFNAELLYAGSIPGGVGVLQVNARAPSGFVPPGLASVQLALGNFAAPPVTAWLK